MLRMRRIAKARLVKSVPMLRITRIVLKAHQQGNMKNRKYRASNDTLHCAIMWGFSSYLDTVTNFFKTMQMSVIDDGLATTPWINSRG